MNKKVSSFVQSQEGDIQIKNQLWTTLQECTHYMNCFMNFLNKL